MLVKYTAHFSDARKQRTNYAGAIVELTVMCIIGERSRIAIFYNVIRKSEKYISVFHICGVGIM